MDVFSHPGFVVEVSLSKTLNPKWLMVCGGHLAWQPLPSVTGDLSRVYPALAQRQLGLAPSQKNRKWKILLDTFRKSIITVHTSM